MKNLTFDVITTKTGDNGKSSNFSGDVLFKDDLLFETLGTLDELNSYLGFSKHKVNKKHKKIIDRIQSLIIQLSSIIATNNKSELYNDLKQITERDILFLEKFQHKLLKEVEIELKFINPGKTETSAILDISRSITRKAERNIIKYIREKERFDLYDIQKFINRLSDTLFTLGRYYEQ